jgi:hypothetical protein
MQPTTDQPKLLIVHVIRAAAMVCGIRREELIGPSKIDTFVRPRHMAMAVALTLTGQSMPAIGRAFGWRDHTTVLHGIRRADEMAMDYPEVRQTMQEIAAKARQIAGLAPRTNLPQEQPLRSVQRPPPVPVIEGALTDAQRREMRKLRRMGWSPKGLRKRFGLPSEEHVYAELGETSPRKLAA